MAESDEEGPEISVTPAAKPAVDLNGPIAAGMNSTISAALGSTSSHRDGRNIDDF